MTSSQNYDDLPMNWVGDWAGRRAALTPNRTALYDSFTKETYTCREMNDRACRVGAYLSGVLGLGKGDVVALICRNRIEAIDIYLACGKLGIILAPLSQRLKKAELDDLLARLAPKVLVHENQFAELVSTLSVPSSVQTVIDLDDDRMTFETVVLATAPRDVNIPLAMNDTCLYVHTGGTTAVPKICIVSYRQMVWNSFDILATGIVGPLQECAHHLSVLPHRRLEHVHAAVSRGRHRRAHARIQSRTGARTDPRGPGRELRRGRGHAAVPDRPSEIRRDRFFQRQGDHHRRRALLEGGDAGLPRQGHSHLARPTA